MSTSTLLIIGDETAARETMVALLEPEDYRILQAGNGNDGLAIALRERPDLVFLDLTMPGMDSYGVCRRLRESPELAEMPVVMVSALDDAQSRADGLEAGADDFITKPFERTELRARTRSITRLNRYRRLLEQDERPGFLARFDPVTHLPNRRLMEEHMAELLRKAAHNGPRLEVISIYIHGLHRINEVFGHALGDEVLRLIGERLRESLHTSDMLARLGGGEFIILGSSDMPEDESARTVRSIRQVCERPLQVDEQVLAVSCSMGVALYPDDGATPEALIQHAETARISAEESGQTCRYYSANINATSADSFRLEVELRQGLLNGEIEVFYQPILEIVSGRCVGAEALARWRHPQRGLVLPGEFIAMAEESGLIQGLGHEVLRQACTQARAWCDRGWKGRLSVNISARQFHDDGCLDRLRQILDETGLAPSVLELELTETAVMLSRAGQATVPLDKLASLRGMGLRMAIDDFGTGYSSLGRLKDMPVDTLKIDRSFIMHLPDDGRAASLTRAVIDLARIFAMDTIAEGVETEAQRIFLSGAGCNLFQGFLVSPPLPAAEFETRFIPRAPAAAS